MESIQDHAEENRRLRRVMRDLVSLSTLPAIWSGLGIRGIASSLADVLINTLALDMVYIRLNDLSNSAIEVFRSKHSNDADELKSLFTPTFDRCPLEGSGFMPDPFQDGELRLASTRFGISSDNGVLIAASRNPNFPTEQERLLLSVGANQTAIVLQRRRAEESLQASDRRKDEFLAILAHELRNPLAPIRNGLQIMRLGKDDPETVDQARLMMERQLEQLVRLVDDLLDISRISRGAIELRKERVELSKVVQNAIEASRPYIEQKGHELTITLPPASIYVDADMARLAQVFSNLLNNAAKYTKPHGLIRLTIQERGGEAVVSVKDNGVGIPSPMLPHIFEMFTQVDRNMEWSQGGLGIGLSIVDRLVKMHGGSVIVASEGSNQGSEFFVRLPVSQAAAQRSSEDRKSAGRLICRKVLVVDDNKDAAMSLATMLTLMGNETRTAHDGEEAIDVAAAYRPDLILLDIGMPRLNGYQTAQRIREQSWSKGMALVALTGWGQEEDRRKSQEAGFDSHVVKPIEFTALETLLANLQADSA